MIGCSGLLGRFQNVIKNRKGESQRTDVVSISASSCVITQRVTLVERVVVVTKSSSQKCSSSSTRRYTPKPTRCVTALGISNPSASSFRSTASPIEQLVQHTYTHTHNVRKKHSVIQFSRTQPPFSQLIKDARDHRSSLLLLLVVCCTTGNIQREPPTQTKRRHLLPNCLPLLSLSLSLSLSPSLYMVLKKRSLNFFDSCFYEFLCCIVPSSSKSK